MNKERLKGFVAGVCTTAVFAGAAAAFAVTADIRTDNFRIFWDGMEQTLKDVKGNVVTPIQYNNSVYVPVRALANLMGVANEDIDYNADVDGFFEVYIKGKPVKGSVWLHDLPEEKFNQSGPGVSVLENKTFKLKDKTISCKNLMIEEYQNNRGDEQSTKQQQIIVVDNKYSRLEAKAVMPYEKVGAKDEGYLSFYSVTDDGYKTRLCEPIKFVKTEDPIDISINLTGVTNLAIQWAADVETAALPSYSDDEIALYDIKLVGKEG